ncbi:MAG: 50S ribosomal protein L23 [Synechococcales cyanobacterium]
MSDHRRALADILIRPVVTEKATRLIEQRQYVFEVRDNATKPAIRYAVQEMFGVQVTSVNTVSLPRQKRRVGKFIGYRPRPKRAIVTLAEGNAITLFPEV